MISPDSDAIQTIDEKLAVDIEYRIRRYLTGLI